MQLQLYNTSGMISETNPRTTQKPLKELLHLQVKLNKYNTEKVHRHDCAISTESIQFQCLSINFKGYKLFQDRNTCIAAQIYTSTCKGCPEPPHESSVHLQVRPQEGDKSIGENKPCFPNPAMNPHNHNSKL